MPRSRVVRLCGVVQAVSLSLWGGGAVFFSLLTTPKIFGYLRDQLPAEPPPGVVGLSADVGRRLAGDVVGAVFPVYFQSQVIVGVLAASAGLVLAWHGGRLDKIRCALVLAGVILVVSHLATVYPISVGILDQSYAAGEAGDLAKAESLREQFGVWHGISQLLNLATMALVMAAVVLSGISKAPEASLETGPAIVSGE